jgi:hypothetical protein
MSKKGFIDLDAQVNLNKKIWKDTYRQAQNFKAKKSIKYTYESSELSPEGKTSNIKVFHESLLRVAEQTAQLGFKPLVINICSENYPLDALKSGAAGEEYDLWRRTNYFHTIYEEMFPLRSDEYILSEEVVLFKNTEFRPYPKPLKFAMMSFAVAKSPQLLSIRDKGKNRDTYSNAQDEQAMMTKIESIFQIAAVGNYDCLVLGAVGNRENHPVDRIIDILNSFLAYWQITYVFFAISTIELAKRDPVFLEYNRIIRDPAPPVANRQEPAANRQVQPKRRLAQPSMIAQSTYAPADTTQQEDIETSDLADLQPAPKRRLAQLEQDVMTFEESAPVYSQKKLMHLTDSLPVIQASRAAMIKKPIKKVQPIKKPPPLQKKPERLTTDGLVKAAPQGHAGYFKSRIPLPLIQAEQQIPSSQKTATQGFSQKTATPEFSQKTEVSNHHLEADPTDYPEFSQKTAIQGFSQKTAIQGFSQKTDGEIPAMDLYGQIPEPKEIEDHVPQQEDNSKKADNDDNPPQQNTDHIINQTNQNTVNKKDELDDLDMLDLPDEN